MKPAIFLSKDAMLLEREQSRGQVSRVRMRPGAVDALLLLSGLGYQLVVIGHEPAVAWGALPMGALEAVSAHLDDIFLTHGFRLAGAYWCPHDPNGSVAEYAFDCACRKPQPGLIQAAARDHDIDVARSWLVSSDIDDIESGLRAGCSTIWLGDIADDPVERTLADMTARDLLDAASRIMRSRDGGASAGNYPLLDAY